MTNQKIENYNELLRERTLAMATDVYRLVRSKNVPQVALPVINQVIRSSSSVAANYRAATRARSDAEFFSKICIVTEECDETSFWLEFLGRINLFLPEEIKTIHDEVGQLVRIFNAIKKKMKVKIDGKVKLRSDIADQTSHMKKGHQEHPDGLCK